MKKKLFVIILFLSVFVRGQEIDMKLIDTIRVDKQISANDKFHFLDKISEIQVVFNRKELIEALKFEMDKLEEGNRYYSAHRELIGTFCNTRSFQKCNFKNILQLESFNYVMANLILNNKVEIYIREKRVDSIRKYERKEFFKTDSHYISYYVFRAAGINFFEILNYAIIE